MTPIFYHLINVKNRVGDDDSYQGMRPQECDREFLVLFIKSLQPNFSANELTFDDLVLKMSKFNYLC